MSTNFFIKFEEPAIEGESTDSEHAKEIRRFTIDSRGMHLGEAFKDAPNVFTGADDSFTR